MTSLSFLPSRPSSRIGLAALGLLTSFALAGCTGGPDLHPGDAAVVDGQRISLGTVDDVAEQTCRLEERSLEQQGSVVPMSFVRSLALETLVTDALIDDFAAEHDIDIAAVRRGVQKEAAKAVAEAPDRLRASAEERIATEGVRRAVLQLVGEHEPGGDASADAAAQAGRAAFATYRKDADVVRDPRFGDVDLDTFAWSGANGSLSFDTAPKVEGIDQAAAAKLPANQRCGSGTPPQQTAQQ